MQGVGEMLGPQELGDALIGGVVDQDRAQQRLLRLEIVRRLAQARIFGAGRRVTLVVIFSVAPCRAFA